jgi:hypothetical protein
MSSSEQPATPNPIAILCIILGSWFLLVPIVNHIELPFQMNDNGILSPAVADRINPLTDYLKFAILLLVPPAIAAMILTLKKTSIDRVLAGIKWLIHQPIILRILTLILIVFWSINRAFPTLRNKLTDAFHEGEYLAYLPSFTQQERPFLHGIFIHGFGLDALPSLLAHALPWVAHEGNQIVMTRFFYQSFSFLSNLSWFWVLWEVLKSVRLKHSQFIWFFAILLFFQGEQSLFFMDGGRSFIFTIQLALTLRFFRSIQLDLHDQNIPKKGKYHSFLQYWIPILIGFLIPISFLHTYDRALYFLLLYLFTSLLSLVLGKAISLRWWVGSALGLVLSSAIIWAIVGIDQIAEMFSQVGFWSKYGRYMFELPMPKLGADWVTHFFWLPIFIQSSVLMYWVWDYAQTRNLRQFIRNHILSLILWVAAVLYMRMGLDRSHPEMAAQSGLITAILFFYLAFWGYQTYVEARMSNFTAKPINQILLACLAIGLIIAEPGSWIELTVDKFSKLDRPDQKILQPHHLAVIEQLKPDIDRQSCFFTATAEGLWHYVLDKPPCTKFWNVLYAQPTVAQTQIIRDLETTQPERILIPDYPIIDGIELPDRLPTLFDYIVEAYQPDRIVGGQWFWHRSQHPLTWAKTDRLAVGSIDRYCKQSIDNCQPILPTDPPIQLRRGKHSFLLGFARLPQDNRLADAVYLSDADRHLIGVHRVNGDGSWGLNLPSMILPLGTSQLQVWAYDSRQHQLFRLSQKISIQVVD